MPFKKIIITLVVLVVAGAIFSFIALQNLDKIIKQTIESVGSQTTQTPVKLAKVEVSLRSGRGELHSLQVDNPQGYSSAYAFLMDQVALQVDPESLLNEVIVIKEIKVDGAKLIAQHKNLQDLNLYTLAKNVQNAAPPASNTEQPQDPQVKTDVRLMIEKITFTNNHIQLISEQLGEQTLNMPTIDLANIGDKEKGLAPHELAKAILKPLLAQVSQHVKAELKTLAKGKGKEKLKELLDDKLTDEQKKKVDKLKSLFGK